MDSDLPAQMTFAPLGSPGRVRWYAPAELRGALVATFCGLLGLAAANVYIFGALGGPVSLTPVFIPAGVILATLLLVPPRRWWLPLIGYFGAILAQALIRGNPFWYAVPAVGGLALQALIGAGLIVRLVPRYTQLDSLSSLFRYAGCVAVGALVCAIMAATGRLLVSGPPIWDTLVAWFLSCALAGVILAPTLLLWAGVVRAGLRRPSRGRLVEAGALATAFLLLGWLGLTPPEASAVELTLLRYAPVPLLVWAAVRFGRLGLLNTLSVVMLVSLAVAFNRAPPPAALAASVLTLQTFLFMVGLPLFALAVLMKERQDGRGRLEQSEAQYHAVVASLPHGAVLLFGPDLRHFFADGQGLPRLGLTTGAVEGKSLRECFPAEMAALLEPHYHTALAGVRHAFELTHEGRIYQAEVLPVTAVDRPSGMVLLQDVTPERLVAELTAANEQLEQANRAQSERVSEVSHELRTPLSSIQAFSELIRDEPLQPTEMKEFSGYINQEALRLNRLVSDLLDLSNIESGRMALHPERLDLNAVVEEVVAPQRLSAPRHVLDLKLDPALPPVVGDRDRLAQVVLNLVSNGIKYSPAGGAVTVGTAHDGQRIHLSVRDEGMGIPPEDLGRIFERYTRVATEEHPAIQGLGLGLPIVRHIVELHGGRVWVESTPGSGSTFHLTLPLAG